MTSSNVIGYARSNVDELREIVERLDERQLDLLVAAIISAPRVFFTGVGRSGLAAKAIAMRLMHIGLSAFAVGEISTPGIADGDLLVTITATGRGSVLGQAETARARGAEVAAVTTSGTHELARMAVATVVLPVRTQVPTAQHAGSLFEQSSLVVGDAVCRVIQERLRVPTAELDKRHANLS